MWFKVQANLLLLMKTSAFKLVELLQWFLLIFVDQLVFLNQRQFTRTRVRREHPTWLEFLLGRLCCEQKQTRLITKVKNLNGIETNTKFVSFMALWTFASCSFIELLKCLTDSQFARLVATSNLDSTFIQILDSNNNIESLWSSLPLCTPHKVSWCWADDVFQKLKLVWR